MVATLGTHVSGFLRKTVRQQEKGMLIRSLKAINHSEALKRYAAAYAGLERELKGLL